MQGFLSMFADQKSLVARLRRQLSAATNVLQSRGAARRIVDVLDVLGRESINLVMQAGAIGKGGEILPTASQARLGRMLGLLESIIDALRKKVVHALRQVVAEYRPVGADADTSGESGTRFLRLVPAHRPA